MAHGGGGVEATSLVETIKKPMGPEIVHNSPEIEAIGAELLAKVAKLRKEGKPIPPTLSAKALRDMVSARR